MGIELPRHSAASNKHGETSMDSGINDSWAQQSFSMTLA